MRHVQFYIGQGTDKDGQAIADLETKVKNALHRVAGTYGGYTAMTGKGGWVNDESVLVQEDSLVIHVFTEESDLVIQNTAEYLRSLFNQSCVMVAVSESDVSFIK